MVGVATNSTAWPHGNRNILVYEWRNGVQYETTSAAGNLWMYAGSIARASVGEGGLNANNSTQTGRVAFTGQNANNPNFADQNWTVMTGVGSGRYGLDTSGTGLMDGACLKCHVALDTASMTVGNHIGADALRHAWNMGGSSQPAARAGNGTSTAPTWDGAPVAGSNRLFLYR